MRDVLLYVLQNLLVLDSLILIVWLLDKCFHWKIGHLWRKWLWALICLRMLIPVEIHLQDFHEKWKGLELVLEVETERAETQDVISENAEQTVQPEEIRMDGIPVRKTCISSEKEAAQSESGNTKFQNDTDTSELSTEIQSSTKVWDFAKHNWELLLMGIWFAGFVITLFFHIFQYYFAKEFFFEEATLCFDKNILSLTENWCQKYGIRRVPQLLEKSDVATPMSFGYFKRKLVYPPDVYDETELSLILQHELVHIKCFDSWYKALILAVCDLYWFNPVFRLMKRMAFQDVEYVCDEQVTRKMTPEEKQLYGAAILKTVKNNSGTLVPSMVQFAVDKKQLKDRLQNLFTFQSWQKGAIPLTLGILFAAIFLIGITVSIKEIPVEAAEHESGTRQEDEATDSAENVKMSVRWETEEQFAGTFYTDDLQALTNQKDVESSYITERFTGFNYYYIDEAGVLWGTGENHLWQLGIPKESDINNLDANYIEPVKIAEDAIHVDANVNSDFVIWLTSDGKLYGLGANTYGVLRMPMVENEAWNPWLNLAPEPQLLMEEVAYASAGKHSISVLSKDGKVWWWGRLQAATGTSGVGKIESREPLLMLENARYTVCGFDTAAAIDKDNNLWLWGCNVWSQCGTEGQDYFLEPHLAESDVEMVWPDFLSSRQNIFDVEVWMSMNPYNDAKTGCIYSYNTFIRKTDGNMYACGIDLGHYVKTVFYYGDLFVENSEYPEAYIRDYSPDFLLIEVQENPR